MTERQPETDAATVSGCGPCDPAGVDALSGPGENGAPNAALYQSDLADASSIEPASNAPAPPCPESAGTAVEPGQAEACAYSRDEAGTAPDMAETDSAASESVAEGAMLPGGSAGAGVSGDSPQPSANEAAGALPSGDDIPISEQLKLRATADSLDDEDGEASGGDAADTAAEPAQRPSHGLDALAIRRLVEGALFTAPGALSAAKLAAVAEGLSAAEVREAVDDLNRLYDGEGHAFRVEEIAGGYRILTHKDIGERLAAFFAKRSKDRLSRAALEVLAIIAYKQPATRAAIETIRGVASDSVVANLLDFGLVRVSGQADAPGRPMLYSTTKKFLDHFGLKSLRDLPREKDFDSMEKA